VRGDFAVQGSGNGGTGREDHLKLQDARFVTGKFVNDSAWQDQRDVSLPDELFQRGQDRLLLIILGQIEPDAGIYQNLRSALLLL
jgi:hypothetical protein